MEEEETIELKKDCSVLMKLVIHVERSLMMKNNLKLERVLEGKVVVVKQHS